ncbi:MAG: hypothetical protein IJO87_08725, partial [Eggerthellaceae bacterium]|nr:hypothetical protein [Eggerthellaceae bacterium]
CASDFPWLYCRSIRIFPVEKFGFSDKFIRIFQIGVVEQSGGTVVTPSAFSEGFSIEGGSNPA